MLYERFSTTAAELLNGRALMVDGAPHRLLEIELYLHAPGHRDPFAHCDPLQAADDGWYLHRTGTGYRGGSFKGIDLIFGPTGTHGGILIRSLRTPEGAIICGPSLCVDHLLRSLDQPDVASLAALLAGRSTRSSGPLWLKPLEAQEAREVYATARVGLTLKRAAQHPTMPAYLMKPYRFLTEPRLRKGRVYTATALEQQGRSRKDTHALTGVPHHTLCRYGEWLAQGRSRRDLQKFVGRALKARDLVEAHGAWTALYDQKA